MGGERGKDGRSVRSSLEEMNILRRVDVLRVLSGCGGGGGWVGILAGVKAEWCGGWCKGCGWWCVWCDGWVGRWKR